MGAIVAVWLIGAVAWSLRAPSKASSDCRRSRLAFRRVGFASASIGLALVSGTYVATDIMSMPTIAPMWAVTFGAITIHAAQEGPGPVAIAKAYALHSVEPVR